jgi:two-component system, NarL family, sensor histidine kinase DegS
MALRKHLAQGRGADLQPALGLGRQAVGLGMETLDVARIHEQALTALPSRGGSSMTRRGMDERTRNFFTETIAPIEKTHRAARKADVRAHQLTEALRRRTAASSASIRHLEQSIVQRQGAEESLRTSGQQHARLLAEAHRLQKHLRHLTHASLSVQEDDRQKMSRQLHDEIAQCLLGIHVRLLTLKQGAKTHSEGLKKEIAKTQRLVKQSVNTIKRAADEVGIWHEP